MSAVGGGGIFVSYRRQESSHLAGRLYDRLADRFGEDQVFIDVDAIRPGVDFAEEIFRAVAACKILLAIIGPAWLAAADEQGGRRLDNPDDIVRLEIEAALSRNVLVIPILIDGAVMPNRWNLPESLATLARRHAVRIGHESFRYDAGRLLTAIEQALVPAVVATPGEAAQQATRSIPGGLPRADLMFAEAERIASNLADDAKKSEGLRDIVVAMAASDPDRAELLARTMIDGSWKMEALSAVAKVLAASDPDRAELLARTMIDGSWKMEALSAVARTLAASDPDRAELLARTITGMDWRAPALNVVAKELVATDPGRAGWLFAEAERLAQTVPDKAREDLVLRAVAIALAVTYPGRAERLARTITSSYLKDVTLSDIAKALADADPDRAEQLASTIARGYMRGFALPAIAKALAATDPDRAEQLASTITSDYIRSQALSAVAKELAIADPHRAAHLFAAAERIVHTVADESLRERVRGVVASELVALDPDRAEQIARAIVDGYWRALALSAMAKASAAADPHRASWLFAEAAGIADSVADESAKIRMLSAVAADVAAAFP